MNYQMMLCATLPIAFAWDSAGAALCIQVDQHHSPFHLFSLALHPAKQCFDSPDGWFGAGIAMQFIPPASGHSFLLGSLTSVHITT
jgi:hypothetical protein